ncbi:MAG: COQ9 family protein [Paracoccaceae bacterium]|nr:MAG: COQ9 family protein [Paracoccaceae bacterium]
MENTADKGTPETARAAILAAALPHVPFEGWSDATLRAAAADSGEPLALARALFPRGGVDLAMAWHRAGDAEMARRLAGTDLATLRFRDRIARAIRIRLELAGDKEPVRRGATLFALPNHAADGARALWSTADAIWTALGDTERNLSWYTKRATLAGVHSSTVLYWLGDDSPGNARTWDFLDRRIEDVMRIEKAKAAFRENPLARALLAGPLKAMERFGMPKMPETPPDLPGRMRM